MLSVPPAVKSVRDRPSYFAEKLYKSMKGAGTDEHTLTRVMVTRSEIDMVQIKQRFQEHYGKTLASFIKVEYILSLIPRPEKRAWYTLSAHAPKCTQNRGALYISVKQSVSYRT